MNRSEVAAHLRELDDLDRDERIERFLELDSLLPDGFVGTGGEAGLLLFEDVKATWVDGAFVTTVISAVAFSCIQLAGLLRSRSADLELPSEPFSLEDLARIAADSHYISRDLQAELVLLADACHPYTDVNREALNLERRFDQAAAVGSEVHPLLDDARRALRASVALLFQ